MPMDKIAIDQAAAILVKARRDMQPLTGLPARLQPTTVAEGHAIQDAVSAKLGKLIGGFKAMAPAGGEATRGIIYAGTVLPSPCDLPAATVPQCGVEGEVAFIFTQALPNRPAPYTRDEVAASVQACAAIEVVNGRFAVDAPVSNLDKLADSISNGALVFGPPCPGWRDLDLSGLHVTLTVNGEAVVDKQGGHPTGDPLGIAVALVNMWREQGGVRAGQIVTCGSWTGMRYLKPGDTCGVTFQGLGAAQVTFTP